MEDNYVSTGQVAKKYGLILGIISIAFFLVTVFGNLAGNSAVSWLGAIPTIAIIFLAHKEFKEQGDGYMSFKQGLGIGTLISLISSVISSVFTFVYVSFVDSTFMDTIKDKQIEKFEEQGMSGDQIEQAMGFTEIFMSPMAMLIMGIIFGVIIGVIISLIISAITKNNNPELEM